MNGKNLRRTAYFAVVWVLIAIIVASGATVAWFTFYASTNVTPITGRIGGTKTLMIANDRSGPFGEFCELLLSEPVTKLEPISTSNLVDFYGAGAQNEEGITQQFYLVSEPYKYIYHGFLYLTCVDDDADVYFSEENFKLGETAQIIASARLGLRITTINEGTFTLIFNLDGLSDTREAQERRTIEGLGVLAGLEENGAGIFTADPSRNISPYFAIGSDEEPIPGETRLMSLNKGEIATVEFFIWLEGCDDNCFNPVLANECPVSLAFAGV